MIQFLRSYFARRQIKRMFGRHVSADRIDELVISGSEPKTDAREAEISPFFASIDGYVSLAEHVSPVQLQEVMNAWFDIGTRAIQAEGGTIDKIAGDVIVAMFGAPLPMSDHGLRACVAALDCQKRAAELRERFRREEAKWPESVRNLRVRIGLNSGPAIVGNMGAAARFNYTMMGDNVNLAARLEKAAKIYGVGTLCTAATRDVCELAGAGRVLFRPLGPIVVGGRAEPMELFEPVALRADVTDELRECIRLFEAGLVAWRERDGERAADFFCRSARLERDQPEAGGAIQRNPSTHFLAMVESYRANPGSGPVVN